MYSMIKSTGASDVYDHTQEDGRHTIFIRRCGQGNCARAAERVAIVYHQECPPWNADLQGSRNQCTNNKVNKSYEHGGAPSFVLSSCHEALVKLLAERRLGCDWALLRFAPREVCRLIKPCRTCHCDYFVPELMG